MNIIPRLKFTFRWFIMTELDETRFDGLRALIQWLNSADNLVQSQFGTVIYSTRLIEMHFSGDSKLRITTLTESIELKGWTRVGAMMTFNNSRILSSPFGYLTCESWSKETFTWFNVEVILNLGIHKLVI